MSNRLLTLAWRAKVSYSAKFVLIALADLERDDGRPNYPSIARLCEMTEFSNRTVLNAVTLLVNAGLIEADRKAGRQTRYRVTLEPVSEVHSLDEPELSTGSEPASQPPVSEVHNLATLTCEPDGVEPVNLVHQPVNLAPKPVSQVHTTLLTPITPKEPERGTEVEQPSSQLPTAALSNPDVSLQTELQAMPSGFLRRAMEIRTSNHPLGALSEPQITEAWRKFQIAKPGNQSLTDWGVWIDREEPRQTNGKAAGGATASTGPVRAPDGPQEWRGSVPPLTKEQREAAEAETAEFRRLADEAGVPYQEFVRKNALRVAKSRKATAPQSEKVAA